MPINRRFLLVRRPAGLPTSEDFRLTEEPAPSLREGEFLVRNHFASLDPAIRGWMDDAPSYLPPIKLGDPLRCRTVGTVLESRHPDFPVGRWVSGRNAIEDYSVRRAGDLIQLIDETALPSITNYLSALGTPGLTAYFALLDAGQPKAGETVLVTGAAGAVGSLVGQIAKMKGCRTIGIAGGPAKCDRLLRCYGYDRAIDYRSKSSSELIAAIQAAAPNGVDLHFENVGGEIFDTALLALKDHARVVLCGLISQYNSEPYPVRNAWQLIVKGARIQGFALKRYASRTGEADRQMSGWLREGRLRVDEHIEEGIENALPALLRLFNGTNTGKMILKLA